jgi:putative ABC transport system permease protein
VKIAWKELVRRPGRFVTAGGALTLITVLLLLLGGLLDGLYLAATSAIRAQSASVIVYSTDARDDLIRSHIEQATRAQISSVPGVESATGFGLTLLGAQVPKVTDPVPVAVFGYEAANAKVTAPPSDGQVWADSSLEEKGVALGQTLLLGPAKTPVVVKGWVSDTSYLFQGALWADASTWQKVLSANRPDQALSAGTFQAILVTPHQGVSASAVASQIDRTVPGVNALTKEQAINALPGVSQQKSTFTAIINTTFLVAGLVVALFFALVTLERVGLFGVLKAIGANSRALAAGLALQAMLIAAGAFAIGALLTLGLSAVIPSTIPLQLLPGRAAVTAVGLFGTALIGSAISFRRVIRIDPASAVGGS